MMRRFESGKGSFGGMMIEATLLVDMLIKYINENGIKKTMELVLEAINNSKGEV